MLNGAFVYTLRDKVMHFAFSFNNRYVSTKVKGLSGVRMGTYVIL